MKTALVFALVVGCFSAGSANPIADLITQFSPAICPYVKYAECIMYSVEGLADDAKAAIGRQFQQLYDVMHCTEYVGSNGDQNCPSGLQDDHSDGGNGYDSDSDEHDYFPGSTSSPDVDPLPLQDTTGTSDPYATGVTQASTPGTKSKGVPAVKGKTVHGESHASKKSKSHSKAKHGHAAKSKPAKKSKAHKAGKKSKEHAKSAHNGNAKAKHHDNH